MFVVAFHRKLLFEGHDIYRDAGRRGPLSLSLFCLFLSLFVCVSLCLCLSLFVSLSLSLYLSLCISLTCGLSCCPSPFLSLSSPSCLAASHSHTRHVFILRLRRPWRQRGCGWSCYWQWFWRCAPTPKSVRAAWSKQSRCRSQEPLWCVCRVCVVCPDAVLQPTTLSNQLQAQGKTCLSGCEKLDKWAKHGCRVFKHRLFGWAQADERAFACAALHLFFPSIPCLWLSVSLTLTPAPLCTPFRLLQSQVCRWWRHPSKQTWPSAGRLTSLCRRERGCFSKVRGRTRARFRA